MGEKRRVPVYVGRDRFEVSIPLREDFRFAHEPLMDSDGRAVDGAPAPDDDLFVGRDQETNELAARIHLSRGGAFLVTGYRGAGKTSFVNHALHRVRTYVGKKLPDTTLLEVRLNIARPMKAVEVMHHVIRSLYRELDEQHLLKDIDVDLARDIEQAYLRTCYEISRNTEQSTESGLKLGLPLLHGITAELSNGGKESRSSGLTTLAYDEKSAEHDLIRLARSLAEGQPRLPGPRRFSLWNLFRSPAPPRKLKIVFVFDELDKLTLDSGEQVRSVDEMIECLKNVLTTSRISFVFVAGKEFDDRWHRELARGDSVYESVFGQKLYLGLLWDAAGSILAQRLARRADPDTPARPDGWEGRHGLDLLGVYRDLEDYLAYYGRGIPRRVLHAFHPFVRWDGKTPYIGLTRRDTRRLQSLAELQRSLDEELGEILGERPGEGPSAERDQRRLGIYYLVDWIMGGGTRVFTESDACDAAGLLSQRITFSADLAKGVVQGLLRLLVAQEFLERVDDATGELQVGTKQDAEPRYRLRPDRLAQMGGDVPEAEEAPRGDLFDLAASGADEPGPPYEVLGLVAEGGIGKILRCWDQEAGREVVVKLLRASPSEAPELVPMITREADALAQLDNPGHPGLVRYITRGTAPDGRPFVVLESVNGPTLRNLLRGGPLPQEVSLDVARQAASAYAYVHDRGFHRIDVKPDNVVVGEDGRVVVVDVGIIRTGNEPEEEGMIGTPLYMPPEQALGGAYDQRVDVYAFGVMLYEMLSGKRPYPSTNLNEMWAAKQSSDPPQLSSVADVPKKVDRLVMRCLARDPEERFASMVEVAAELGPADLSRSDLAGVLGQTRVRIEEQREETKFADEVAAPTPATVHPPPPAPAAASAAPPAPVAPRPPEPVARLALIQGPDAPRTVPVGSALTVGRAPECELILNHPFVSRRQFQIDGDVTNIVSSGLDRVWRITDRSANGTSLNGKILRGEATIRRGDRIEVGPFVLELQVEWPGEGPATDPD